MHRRGPPQARARYELHRVHRKCGNIVENGAIVGSGDCASLYFAASERNAAPFPNLGNHPRLASFLSLFPDCRLVAFHTIRRQPPCRAGGPLVTALQVLCRRNQCVRLAHYAQIRSGTPRRPARLRPAPWHSRARWRGTRGAGSGAPDPSAAQAKGLRRLALPSSRARY